MTPRYLTKSRFKLALECPTRLYYAGHPEYFDDAAADPFLAALAEGGYQVGALACAMFPDGVQVDDVGHAAQVDRTCQLLQQENVTIFEAALEAEGLFVRVDILRKRGQLIELIEVKAKSFDPRSGNGFRGAKGRLQSRWLPYLRDIAFQTHVAALAYPQFQYRSSLMLADKSATATVDGLNQRFRVRREGRQINVEVASGTNVVALGAPLLVNVPVDDLVAEIQNGDLQFGSQQLPFPEVVRLLAESHGDGTRLPPSPGAQCGSCQFKTPSPPGGKGPRSGFHECWSEAFGWSDADFAGGTTLDIWNLRKKDELLALGVRKPNEITLEHLGHDGAAPDPQGMSARHRQWYQCHGGWPGGDEYFFNAVGMREAISDWRYPLHFIDFETCAVAIPFSRGRRPYETVAFQFSHHVMHEDGRVEHRSQFLEATPGVDPSVPFVRALRHALQADEGTVLRWASHENSVLNELRQRLLDDVEPPADSNALVAFIETITTRKVEGVELAGPRRMVDLCKLAELHYFCPSTHGSSSLKKVLPALMRSSAALRETYGHPVYGSDAMPSLNFSKPVNWCVGAGADVQDPYDLLPAVVEGTGATLKAGGAAMTAYAQLQFEELEPVLRQALESALLRYCELDTLAMVMAVQAWQRWCADSSIQESPEAPLKGIEQHSLQRDTI